MPKRRKLGTVYELTPVRQLHNWIGENSGRFVFCIVLGIIWIGVYYVILGIVAFLLVNIQQVEKEVSAQSLIQTPASSAIIIVGTILISLYVFRDSGGRKKKTL